MLPSSAECRRRAEQKLAQAELDKRRSRKLVTAAEAWLLLAIKIAELERWDLERWDSVGTLAV